MVSLRSLGFYLIQISNFSSDSVRVCDHNVTFKFAVTLFPVLLPPMLVDDTFQIIINTINTPLSKTPYLVTLVL